MVMDTTEKSVEAIRKVAQAFQEKEMRDTAELLNGIAELVHKQNQLLASRLWMTRMRWFTIGVVVIVLLRKVLYAF